MNKQGFTLIELLVVITIIAILAGAAMPYVNNYIEDTRISRANSDLNEIRNAIMRYETERSSLFNPGLYKTGADYREKLKQFQSDLVGPYLMQAMSDPWGRPYYYSYAASMVLSGAEDGSLETNIVSKDCRPGMAITRAWWTDNNNNSMVDNGDFIDFRFSRPIGGMNPDVASNFMVYPAKNPTARTNPFGDGAVFEDFSGNTAPNRKHPRGHNWLRVVVKPNANIMSGDRIIASDTIFDTTDAAIAGNGNKGIYTDDMVENEELFPAGTVLYVDKCKDLSVVLKPAQ